jgi:hypothetical protein
MEVLLAKGERPKGWVMDHYIYVAQEGKLLVGTEAILKVLRLVRSNF